MPDRTRNPPPNGRRKRAAGKMLRELSIRRESRESISTSCVGATALSSLRAAHRKSPSMARSRLGQAWAKRRLDEP